MVRRLYPVVVTLTGGIGLGLALMYLMGVVLAFLPGWEAWADFFVPLALYLMILPYGLLIAHMVLRNHVGRFLLNRQAYEDAEEYSRRRRNASMLRSRREVANHTVIVARALLGQGDYEAARQLLMEEENQFPGSYKAEARRLLFEVALRQDDRERAEELCIEGQDDEKAAGKELAAILGCEAELALRLGDLERYREKMKAAIWEKASHPRVGLCRALAMLEYESEEEQSDEVIALLGLVEESVAREIPARRAELEALRAMALWRRGRREKAKELLKRARSGPCDHWTDEVIRKVRAVCEG